VVNRPPHAASFPSGAIHRRSASQSHCGKKWPIASDDAGTALPFDPVSGRVSGQRAWSACRLGRSPISETSVGGRFAAITPVGVRFLRTRFIGAGAFFCARWGARGAECLPRDVRRRSSQATSRFDGSTVHRCLCVRTGSGIMEARPHPERCPRQEPVGRNRPATFTLCYKVNGPSALPRALSQWTRGKGMKMIENGQNKAGFSGVCRFQITTYDKESEVLQGP
jgi:hypothetical protein